MAGIVRHTHGEYSCLCAVYVAVIPRRTLAFKMKRWAFGCADDVCDTPWGSEYCSVTVQVGSVQPDAGGGGRGAQAC